MKDENVIPDGERYNLRGVKTSVNDDFFDTMGKEQYWVIGLWASDGFIKDNHIGICQSGDDGLKRVSFVKQLLNLNYTIASKEPARGKTVYFLRFSSDKIANTLKKFGIVQNKTKKYTLPEYINESNIRFFLQGFIEGDGCITIIKHKHATDMLCASFVGTQDFIMSCANLIPIKGTIRKHSLSDICEIRWYSKNAIAFCEWLFEDGCIYESYKYQNYIIGKDFYKKTRDYMAEQTKQKLISDFNNGVINSVKEAAIKYNINKTQCYNWFKEFYSAGLLNRDYHLKR